MINRRRSTGLRPVLACATGLFLFTILLSLQARSQVQFRTPGNDSIKVVQILNSETYRFQKVNDSVELTVLVGNVKIKQEKTLIYCDSLIMNPHDNYIECFGHAHINDNDSVNIYSDYLKYEVDKKMVHFLKNVTLTDGKGTLTTQELQYDMAGKIGTYENGGKIVNKETVLTSDKATYFELSKDVHFHDHVIMQDPQYDLSADSLLYNTETQIATFITETFIKFKDSSQRTVRTREGFYNLKTKKAQFGKRPFITDGSKQLTGDDVQFDDSTGISTAIGNAIFKDTTQGVTLYANYMISNKKRNTFLATQRPLMALKQDKDSLYVTADTLASGRLMDFESDQRRIAHDDSLHRIYIDSVEKVQADSLHKLTILRRKADSLQAIKDSLNNIGDHSDSLRAGVADSLGKIGLDSLHRERDSLGREYDSLHYRQDSIRRAHGDTTGLKGVDSLTAKRLKAAADSAARPLTRKEQKQRDRLAKEKAEAKIKAIKDSIADVKYDLQMKQRAYKDSVRNAQEDEKLRQREKADSIRRATTIENFRARNRAADSVRRLAYIDSLKKTGMSDSAVNFILDSANRRRRADSIALDDARKARIAAFNDTINRKKDPVILSHEDSLALIPTTDTSLRYITGYHHVRIFSDSLQAVADSMYYSTKDSLFRLFYSPVAWGSGNYQITGDTMFVYTKNKKAKRLYVFENALSINREASNFYNQLKGTTINCFFLDGEIDFIRAKGNAESIYYIKDEKKAYTGTNKAHADVIDMVFAPKLDSLGKPALDSAGKSKGKELNRVILRNDAEGSMIPIRRVNPDDMRLRGFKWLEDKRPKSKQELFDEIKKKGKYEDDDLPVYDPTALPPTPRGGMPKVLVTPQTIQKPAAPTTPPKTKKKP
ncbi:MAG TPA: OstA-like protein [Puia sp.]|nr:OstA-like protein [Puia sp.]